MRKPSLFASLLIGSCCLAGPPPPWKPDLSKLPVYFIENRGQAASSVRYYLAGRDKSILLKPGGITVVQHSPESAFRNASLGHQQGSTHQIHVDFPGADPHAIIEGESENVTRVNYFVGDSSRHRSNIPTWRTVRYRNLWPGIDLVYRTEGRQVKYQFEIAPGADPSLVRMVYHGADLSVTGNGSLRVATRVGAFTDDTPYSFQERGGRQVEVLSSFQVKNGEVTFRLGDYDRSRRVVIDPATQIYASIIGGAGQELPAAIVLDYAGQIYIGGSATSAILTPPDTPLGGYDGTANGGYDAFIAKINASATAVLAWTLYGGTGQDDLFGLALSADGTSVYAAGRTQTGVPVTAGALQSAHGGAFDGFVARFSSSLASLNAATMYGGCGLDSAQAIAVDTAGNAYVTGYTASTSLPGATALPRRTYSDTVCGTSTSNPPDAFALKINAAMTTATYSGYIGGSGHDWGWGLALNPSDNSVVIVGQTQSANFPGITTTATGFDTAYDAQGDAFIVKLSPAGQVLSSSFLGGPGEDAALAVDLDLNGNAYIAGKTASSSGFPNTTALGPQGNGDGFAAKVNIAPSGALTSSYTAYVATSAFDRANGIAVLPNGRAWVGGFANGNNLKNASNTIQGIRDGYVALLNETGSDILCSAYIGGSGHDTGTALAVDSSGNPVLTGYSAPGSVTGFTAIGGVPASDDAFLASYRCSEAQSCFNLDTAGLTSSLRAWYPLEETVAVDDVTTNNNDGAYKPSSSNRPVTIPGAVGSALLFDGIDDYLEMPSSSSLNLGTGSFTIDAWVKIKTPNFGIMIDKRSSSATGYHFFQYGEQIGFQINGVNYLSPKIPVDDKWRLYAVVVTRSGTTGSIQFLMNGALIPNVTGYPSNTQTLSAAIASANVDNTQPLRIGLRSAAMGGGNPYAGGLDEVEIFARALTTAEIKSIYDASAGGKCALACGPASKLPDFTVSSVTAPSSVTLGNSMTVSVTGANNSALVAGLINVRVALSPNQNCAAPLTPLGTLSFPLNVAGAQTLSLTAPAGALAGNYWVCTTVDPGQQVRECNESNQTGTPVATSLVAACPRPDFAAPFARYQGTIWVAGYTGTVGVSLQNIGTAYVPPPFAKVRVEMVCGNTAYLIGTKNIPAMASGATQTISVTGVAPNLVNTQSCYVRAILDSQNVVNECNESNNGPGPAIPFTVLALPQYPVNNPVSSAGGAVNVTIPATQQPSVFPNALLYTKKKNVQGVLRFSVSAGPAVFLAARPSAIEEWTDESEGTQTINGLEWPRLNAMAVSSGNTLTIPATGSDNSTETFAIALGSDGFDAARTLSVTAEESTSGLAITGPTEGQVVSVPNVTFTWTPVTGATGYDVRVTPSGSTQPVFTGQLSGGGSTSTVINLPAGVFTFEVRSCSDAALTTCGSFVSRGFSVVLNSPAGSPTITAPANGANLTASTQALSWTSVTGATLYQVTLRNNTTNTTDLFHSVLAPDVSTVFSLRSGQYTMEVRACSIACGQPATSNFSVTLPPVPTQAPVISSATVTNQNGQNQLNVVWGAVPNADLYLVQVVQPAPAGPGGGALTVASVQVSSTTTTLTIPNGRAFVFVGGCNGNGCGPNSAGSEVNPAFGTSAVPRIGSPAAGTIVDGPTVLIGWNRIPGDNGSNTVYRLFVQDFARQAPALDVLTTSNFYAAQFNAGRRYDALVIANGTIAGPAQGFTTRGGNPLSPTMVSPQHNSSRTQGNIPLGWTTLPGGQLYQYFVAVSGNSAASATGVTTGTEVQVPLSAAGGASTTYSGIVRACTTGTSCSASSDAGWGPWSNAPGGAGVTTFNIIP